MIHGSDQPASSMRNMKDEIVALAAGSKADFDGAPAAQRSSSEKRSRRNRAMPSSS